MEKRLESNFWKYTLVLIANKRVFVAILGAYYLTIPGVTPQTIGTILLASTLASFLFEIPSGYMSDKVGHKQTLVLSRILMLLSTLSFLVSESFIGLVVAGVLMSLAGAFLSGTGSAFMHETLKALKRENDYSRVMGKISAIGFAVPIIFMMFIPFLVSYSYKLPFLIALVTDIVGLVAALLLMRPSVPPEHIEEIGVTNFKQAMKEASNIGFLPLAFFVGIMGGIMVGLAGFRAPYQLFLEIPVIWFGVLFGIGRMLASLMLAYSGRIREYFTLLSFYRFELVLYTLLLGFLGTISNPWVVIIVFILLNAFQWGLSKISEGFHLEVIRKSKFKATLLSITSLVNDAVAAFSGFSLGFLIERFSYQSGFMVFATVFLVALFPLYLYIAHKYNKGVYNTENLVDSVKTS